MTFFESADDRREPAAQSRASGRRTARVLSVVSILLAVVFLGTMLVGALPGAARLWVADNVPGSRSLVRIPEPQPEAVAIADELALTDDGRALFYESEPYIADAAEIAQVCSDGQELPGDLYHAGCYLSVDRIYILREGDAALMLVTAAHELLHAAYARLGDDERARVDALVSLEVQRIAEDDPVHVQIAASAGGDEAAEANEAFAYLGSQVVLDGGFAPQLEEVYARWFTDRAAVAASAR
ncbi:hypothetical protein ACFQRL_01795 [Microbacterium fluvii]|uniref:Metalloprotease n=1 Tax=Microbacterium fluvii TaxID=415215 RepID=A0ABW2H9I9_9MICO|nr:hypothetical protein [Microbacterium fluvii]MCU4671321.1 hypothetical protein [Microbacterium fluvii]